MDVIGNVTVDVSAPHWLGINLFDRENETVNQLFRPLVRRRIVFRLDERCGKEIAYQNYLVAIYERLNLSDGAPERIGVYWADGAWQFECWHSEVETERVAYKSLGEAMNVWSARVGLPDDPLSLAEVSYEPPFGASAFKQHQPYPQHKHYGVWS